MGEVLQLRPKQKRLEERIRAEAHDGAVCIVFERNSDEIEL